LNILLKFVSSDAEMLGVLTRYTRWRKTTQPGIQACPVHSRGCSSLVTSPYTC